MEYQWEKYYFSPFMGELRHKLRDILRIICWGSNQERPERKPQSSLHAMYGTCWSPDTTVQNNSLVRHKYGLRLECQANSLPGRSAAVLGPYNGGHQHAICNLFLYISDFLRGLWSAVIINGCRCYRITATLFAILVGLLLHRVRNCSDL
jgi:hypothetical protein